MKTADGRGIFPIAKYLLSFIVLSSMAIAGVFFAYAVSFPALKNPASKPEGGNFKAVFDKISVTDGCGADRYVRWFNADGSLICGDVNTLMSAPTPIESKYSISGKGLYPQYFKNILSDCWAGRYVQWFSADKKLICSDKDGGITQVGEAIAPRPASVQGSFPVKPGIDGYTAYFDNMFSNDCWPKKAITGFKPDGVKLGCRDNSCLPTVWTPAVSDVCKGTTFTQTSNCGNTNSAVGTKVWDNISKYSNTSSSAGWHISYTSTTYPFKVHFKFHVWTEDLIYDIRCYDDKGNELQYFWPGGKDKDWDIDHYSSSCYANKIVLSLTEWGHSGADAFGYTLDADATCGGG